MGKHEQHAYGAIIVEKLFANMSEELSNPFSISSNIFCSRWHKPIKCVGMFMLSYSDIHGALLLFFFTVWRD